MKAITKFFEVLSDNYYEKFLIADPFCEENLYKKYFWEVEYKKKRYFELDIDVIQLSFNEHLENIQDKHKKAISEIYLLVSNKNINEINSIIENLKKSVLIHLETIKNDFYIDDSNSRYYSLTVYSNQYFSINEAIIKFSKEIHMARYYKAVEAQYTTFDLWYDNKRDTVLSYLPFALFTIGKAFVEDLERIKNDAIINEMALSIPLEDKLKWDGKPAHLGYILGVLADSGFIDAPKRDSGDINYTKFSKQVLNIFDIKTTENTLSKYLNTTTEKAQETQRNFNKANFNIPHKKEVN